MDIIDIIQKEFHLRLYEEGFTRIEKCLTRLDEKEVWLKPNANSNSVGNLILHLEGNIRQYILSGIKGDKDTRTRDLEFSTVSEDIHKAMDRLRNTILDCNACVTKLKIEVLTETRSVQGFDLTVLSIIIHVIEHFSYHVGQITFFTKMKKNVDTGYYEGMDLNLKSS